MGRWADGRCNLRREQHGAAALCRNVGSAQASVADHQVAVSLPASASPGLSAPGCCRPPC